MKAPLPTNAVTTAAITDANITSAKIDFTTFAGIRNDSTNLSSLTGIKIQSGWGQFLGNGTNSQNVTITFPTAFTTSPYCIIVKLVGYRTSGTLTTLKDVNNGIGYQFDVSTPAITNSNCTANFSTSASFGAAYHAYSWIAIGI